MEKLQKHRLGVQIFAVLFIVMGGLHFWGAVIGYTALSSGQINETFKQSINEILSDSEQNIAEIKQDLMEKGTWDEFHKEYVGFTEALNRYNQKYIIPNKRPLYETIGTIVLPLVIAVMCFLAGIGLFKMRQSSRKLAVATSLMFLFEYIYNMLLVVFGTAFLRSIFDRIQRMTAISNPENATNFDNSNFEMFRIIFLKLPYSLIHLAIFVIVSIVIYFFTRPSINETLKN